MRLKPSVFLLAAFLLPAVATAQRQRMPQAGGWSFWGLAGLVSPADEVNDNTVGLSGGLDYYLTRSFSLGVAAGFWRADSDLADDTRVGYFTATAGYNWEFGKLHPFVQGGAGLYRLEFPFNSETKFGAFGGGGLDYFLTRAFAVEGVLRYHVASEVGRFDTNFFEALGGVKFYF